MTSLPPNSRWTIVREDVGRSPDGARLIEARCVCGTQRIARRKHVLSGRSSSCGCSHVRHGQAINSSRTHEYSRWLTVVQRCTNPKNPGYKEYGARGITICDRWRQSFEAFFEDMGECPPGLSLDRIDNGGPYSKENCRWATQKEQHANRRNAPSPEQLEAALQLRQAGMSFQEISRKIGINRESVRRHVRAVAV